MRVPAGKGIWIQRVAACEGGEPGAIAARAVAAGLGHVIVRIGEGRDAANLRPDGADLAAAVIEQLTAAGIAAWGWHHLHGDAPGHRPDPAADDARAEADAAVARAHGLRAHGLVGLIVEARTEYERAVDPAIKAEHAMRRLRDGLPQLPLGVSSWKLPEEHPNFPWYEFRRLADFDLPHIFWMGQPAEAARQLAAAQEAYASLPPRRPFGAVGSALWRPQPGELLEFLAQARRSGLAGASIWRWDELGLRGDEPHNGQRLDFRAHWDVVAGFEWPIAAPNVVRGPTSTLQQVYKDADPAQAGAHMPETLRRFFGALRRGRLNDIVALYAAGAAHLSTHQARYGLEALAVFYQALLRQPELGTLAVLDASAAGDVYVVRWVLAPGRHTALAGSDTFHLNRRGEIVFHSTALA